MTLIRPLVVTFLIAALSPVVARAQNSPAGTIQGVVTATNPEMLVGATVRAESDQVTVTTDPAADGSYVFTGLAPGRYRVDVLDSSGRSLATGTVTIGLGGITQSLNLTARLSGIGVGPAPDEPPRFRSGAFGITPSFAFSSFGVDTNVFNEPDDSRKRNTALNLIPQTVVTLDAGRLRGGALARGSYLYFDKYSDQRSLSGEFNGRAELSFGRITPWVDGGVDGGQRRLNHEVDLRTRLLTTNVRIGVDGRFTSRTVASVEVGRVELGFDPADVFRTVSLQTLLNHQADAGAIEIRQGITNRITALVRGGARRYRFRFAPQRDADATTGEGGAAISITDAVAVRAHVGYIDFTGVGNEVADYRGGIASVQASLVLPSRTRVQVDGTRDLIYSYEPRFPYFISTAGSVAVEHDVLRAWNIRARLAGEQMAHHVATRVSTGGYTEGYAFLGAGVGYTVARTLRVGFDFGREQRGSPFLQRAFIGSRFGASATIGSGPLVGGPLRQ